MAVLYLCDRQRCGEQCNESCRHTSDIKHAANFNEDEAGNYWERSELERFRDKIWKELQNNTNLV